MKCSVLLSAYNSGSRLDQTLQSVLKQTFQDFCVVAVNDGSTDDTPTNLQKWQGIFGEKRFQIITNERNIGLTRSLNRGLEVIQTQFTARIDSGDQWHPKKLERQVRILSDMGTIGVIGSNYVNVSSSGKREEVVLPESDSEIKKSIFFANPLAHSAVVFDTVLIKSVGGYDESVLYGQDYDLWLNIFEKTQFFNVQAVLCIRHNDEASISANRQNAQMLQGIQIRLKYLQKYKMPLLQYGTIIVPALTLLTPRFVRRLKRKYYPKS